MGRSVWEKAKWRYSRVDDTRVMIWKNASESANSCLRRVSHGSEYEYFVWNGYTCGRCLRALEGRQGALGWLWTRVVKP